MGRCHEDSWKSCGPNQHRNSMSGDAAGDRNNNWRIEGFWLKWQYHGIMGNLTMVTQCGNQFDMPKISIVGIFPSQVLIGSIWRKASKVFYMNTLLPLCKHAHMLKILQMASKTWKHNTFAVRCFTSGKHNIVGWDWVRHRQSVQEHDIIQWGSQTEHFL